MTIQFEYPIGTVVNIRLTGKIHGIETSVTKRMIIVGHNWSQRYGEHYQITDYITYTVAESSLAQNPTTILPHQIESTCHNETTKPWINKCTQHNETK